MSLFQPPRSPVTSSHEPLRLQQKPAGPWQRAAGWTCEARQNPARSPTLSLSSALFLRSPSIHLVGPPVRQSLRRRKMQCNVHCRALELVERLVRRKQSLNKMLCGVRSHALVLAEHLVQLNHSLSKMPCGVQSRESERKQNPFLLSNSHAARYRALASADHLVRRSHSRCKIPDGVQYRVLERELRPALWSSQKLSSRQTLGVHQRLQAALRRVSRGHRP